MIRYTIAYAVTAVVFLDVDYIWLRRAMGFYRNSLGDLLAEKPNLLAAAAFYLIYFVGIVVFAVMPAAKTGGWASAILGRSARASRICHLRPDQSCDV